MTDPKDIICIRCNSHRARHKMYQAIGKQQSYFSWGRKGEYYLLDPPGAKIALEITGISKARNDNDLNKTISF